MTYGNLKFDKYVIIMLDSLKVIVYYENNHRQISDFNHLKKN